ncbi:MAG: AlpA family phage regulatory protein [bacterium]|nr:AlpA family phage regulatory protein [bacterium]
MPAVLAATGLSRTTLWRLRRTGEFPAPVRLGGDASRAVGWLRSDIEEWILSRPAA